MKTFVHVVESKKLETDKNGNTWNAKKLEEGSQVWTLSRNGQTTNKRINSTPKSYNSETVLFGQDKFKNN